MKKILIPFHHLGVQHGLAPTHFSKQTLSASRLQSQLSFQLLQCAMLLTWAFTYGAPEPGLWTPPLSQADPFHPLLTGPSSRIGLSLNNNLPRDASKTTYKYQYFFSQTHSVIFWGFFFPSLYLLCLIHHVL